MRVSYYAVFNYDEYDKSEEKYGISITFPDITEANTCARNYAEGVDMALDVLQLCLIDSEIEAYPKPSSIENIRLGKNEKAVLIQYDTDKIDISKFKFFNEWSNSRSKLCLEWETSGNYQHIVSVESDCDKAAILNYGGFLCVKNFVIKQPVKILWSWE